MFRKTPIKIQDRADTLKDFSPHKKQDGKCNIVSALNNIEEEMANIENDPFSGRVTFLKDSISAMLKVVRSLKSEEEKTVSHPSSQSRAICSLSCNLLKQESTHLIGVITQWTAEKRKEINSLKRLLPDHCKIETPEVLVNKAAKGSFLLFQLKVSPDRTIADLIRIVGISNPGNYWFYPFYTEPADMQTELKARLQSHLKATQKGVLFGICPNKFYPDGSVVKSDSRSMSTANDDCGTASNQWSPAMDSPPSDHSPPFERRSSLPGKQMAIGQNYETNDDSLRVPRHPMSRDGRLRSPSRDTSTCKGPVRSNEASAEEVIKHSESALNSIYRDKRTGRIAEIFVNNSRLLQGGQPSVYELKATETWSSKSLRWFQIGEPTSSVNHKFILLMGATGSGKSTLVDAMFNYVLGVCWNDPFRFKIVPEKTDMNQAHSQTKHVTAYTLHHIEGLAIPYSLTVIDTPGYGDTEGLKRDEEITRIISDFLIHKESSLNEINAVCFVASSADARLTQTQKYVLTSVLSLFGNDVRSNIRLIVTFSDGGTPPVVEACREAGFPLPNDSVLAPFNKFNNSVLFTSNCSDDENNFDQAYWTMAFKNFGSFFESLERLPTRSLEQTKKVIVKRMELENNAEVFNCHVENLLAKIWEIQLKMKDVGKSPNRCKQKGKQGFFSFGSSHETVLMNPQLLKNMYTEQMNHSFTEMANMFRTISEASRELQSTALLQTAPTLEDCVHKLRSRLEKENVQGWQDKIDILSNAYQQWKTGGYTKVVTLGRVYSGNCW